MPSKQLKIPLHSKTLKTSDRFKKPLKSHVLLKAFMLFVCSVIYKTLLILQAFK